MALLAPRSAVILISGGIDSAVMLARTLGMGVRAFPLYVRQGALWEDDEETALRRLLEVLASWHPDLLEPLNVARLDFPAGYAGRWAVDSAVPPPDASEPDKAVYLPGRNLALLTQGGLLAQSVGAATVQLGTLAGNPFPDATAAFFRSFEETFLRATRYAVAVEAPLATLGKEEVIRAGTGLPLEFTWSCIRPLAGCQCGRCNKCAERRRAFARAGVADSTPYAQPEG